MGGNDRLLRAARGESLDRPPVWMMRQAGRYMQAYRQLRERYPDFRQRSENPDIATEISLQPFHAFHPDGVIMFSDILTPLPGMGIDFDIIESRGPLIDPPIRTKEQIDRLHTLRPEESLPFIRTILRNIRREVKDQATVLGFVGAPWTLAAYAIEGKSSKDFVMIKSMGYQAPQLLHKFLEILAENIAIYICYQIEAGAQAVQLFDSWAGNLSPLEYETFALPYTKHIVTYVHDRYPDVPLILYICGCGGILERMAQTGVDVISVDWMVTMKEARQRLGETIAVQGNLDPCVLFAPQDYIRSQIIDVVNQAGPKGHIMNLGHGVLSTTPEENVRFFFETVKSL